MIVSTVGLFAFTLFINFLLTMSNMHFSFKKKNLVSFITLFLRNYVLIFLVALLLSRFIFKNLDFSDNFQLLYQSFLGYIPQFCLIFFIIAALAGFSQILIHRLFFVSKGKKRRPWQWALIVICVILIFLSALIFALGKYFVANFGNISVEQMMFNFTSPTTGMANNQKILILFGPILMTFTPLFIMIFLLSINNEYKARKATYRIDAKKILSILLIINILIFVCSGYYGYKVFNVEGIIRQVALSEEDFFADNYVDPQDVEIKQVEKRNIIHLYLESMETTYLSKELGGNNEVNLLPELTKIAQEDDAVVFSHNDNYFGGAKQVFGTSWSVAGMVNNDSGVPLKVPVEHNEDKNGYGTNGIFLPGITNLGDILEYYGYTQEVMFGADADFGGLTTYFTDHGNYTIKDWKWAKETGRIPEDYLQNWGYEDDKLWAYAKEAVENLAENDEPFNFVLETADTHFPNGYQGKNTPQVYDKPYANAIQYSDYCTAQFIRWCQSQDWYENTTIIINGDHLSMDTAFFEDLDPNYERTTFNVILNPAINVEDESILRNREWTSQDYFPTILAACGFEIEGDRLGLGTNLFSGQKTLLEQYGFDEYNAYLERRSKFFEDNFLNDGRGRSANGNTYQPE